MKKALKIALFSLMGLFLIIILLALYVNVSGIPSYENLAEELSVEMTEDRVAEGARMAATLCLQCHGSKDGKLGGAHMADNEDFGEIYAPNITQHPEFGITEYSDGELAYLFRTGIRKDGQYTPPWMPKFPLLSDEDMYSLIAFLRSNDPMVQPSEYNPPEPKPNFLAKLLSRVAFKPLPYPDARIIAPPSSDKVAFGRYLAVGKYDCFSCHSASFQHIDLMIPENSKGFFGGGNRLLDHELNEIYSSNLTMDHETGLGSWSEEDFIKTLRFGIRPDGIPLSYPMVPAPTITPEEASAIWAYLRSIPVIVNKVE